MKQIQFSGIFIAYVYVDSIFENWRLKLGIDAETLKLRAYHEAGHAVIAYLSGFSCNFLEITDKDPISNRDNYDLGVKATLISAMNRYRDHPGFYDNLPPVIKINSRKTALKTIIVLLAGQAAEKIYINGGREVVNPPINRDGEDITPADNIDYFLSVVKNGQHPMNYLKIVFRQVAELISSKEVWPTVTMLAEALFISPEKKLVKSEIEKLLHETGYMDYLDRLKKKQSPGSSNPQNTEKPVQQDKPSNPEEETMKSQISVGKVINTEKHEEVEKPEGFSREELLKMKELLKNSKKLDKKEGVRKIAEFVKNMKISNLYIGLTCDPEKDLYESFKVDKNDKSSHLIVNAQNYAVAKEIMMYFICLGMEIYPDSSKSKEASKVFVMIK